VQKKTKNAKAVNLVCLFITLKIIKKVMNAEKTNIDCEPNPIALKKAHTNK
jgi:hypothetical protein